MSPVYEDPGFAWHEDELILDTLWSEGTSSRAELWPRVQQRQRAAMRMITGTPDNHTRSNFYRRIRVLCGEGFIAVSNNLVKMTRLGEWAWSNGREGFLERRSFLNTWRCQSCTNKEHVLVLRYPSAPETLQAISYVGARCARCGSSSGDVKIAPAQDVAEFHGNYDKMVRELRRFVAASSSESARQNRTEDPSDLAAFEERARELDLPFEEVYP